MSYISYKMYNNNNIFNEFNKNGLKYCQNYIPIYNKIFDISNNIIDKINIEKKNHIQNMDYCKKKFEINNKELNFFIKFSPLINPVKYLVGEYNCENMKLPNINIDNNLIFNYYDKKILNYNNASYIDSFFNYLSSNLLDNYNFINCINFYGSFLCIQERFKINFFDDIEVLLESDFFLKNQNKLFKIEKELFQNIFNSNTKKFKQKIKIDNSNSIIDLDDISDINSNDFFYNNNSKLNTIYELYNNEKITKNNEKNAKNSKFKNNNNINEIDINNKNIDIKNYSESDNSQNNISESDSSESDISESDSSESDISESDSSESDNSDNSDDSDGSESDNSDDSDGSESDNSDGSESDSSIESFSSEYINDKFIVEINNFPVQIICLEKLNITLDLYLKENNISEDEWLCILFQIIITLVAYQKIFKLTHNDLHTNNIMIKKTDKEYIYYKYDNIYYKVKTYGKIYKIIDFGRSIYYYNSKLFCSDSFEKNEDGYTQYNFAHLYNNKKREIKPNMSFDLCRLGCSLIEHIVDDFEEFKKLKETKSKYKKIIYKWIIDDKNKNILYKSNGDERYEDFDLYKKIARNVNNNIPKQEIKNEIFNEFIIKYTNIINDYIIDIDNMKELF